MRNQNSTSSTVSLFLRKAEDRLKKWMDYCLKRETRYWNALGPAKAEEMEREKMETIAEAIGAPPRSQPVGWLSIFGLIAVLLWVALVLTRLTRSLSALIYKFIAKCRARLLMVRYRFLSCFQRNK